MIVTLQPITRDNWLQCVRLNVAPEQKHFVASNAVSLAAYDGDTMVGFAMYAWNTNDNSIGFIA